MQSGRAGIEQNTSDPMLIILLSENINITKENTEPLLHGVG
jgi:hypothetical protein